MRASLIIAILTTALVQVHATSYGQQVSLNVNNADLKTVIKQVQSQSGYSFLYTDEMLDQAQPVSIHLKKATIEETLQALFQNQPINYSIDAKTVILQRKEPSLLDKVKSALNLDKITINGKVTDEKGLSLPGATVQVKGTNNIATTDTKGLFTLKNVDPNATIVVSFIGYEKQELKAEKDMGIIVLKIASNQLDAVQVIAYGQESQRLSVGDVGSVKAADIEKQPVSNVLEALEGHVPGLLITQASGMPGSSYTVQIRGLNSIANGNDPYYVVDGVPYISQLLSSQQPAGGSPMDYINPNDIESITILKDADATAIYGSKAANGAILITTKKGKAGKTRLDVNLTQGIGQAPQETQWMNTAQYLAMRKEAIANDGVPVTDPSVYAPDLLNWNQSRYTNWQKYLTGNNASYTDAHISLSGGNSNTQYLFGTDFDRQTTVFPFSADVPRGAFHLNVNNVSNDGKLKMSVTVNYVLSSSNLPQRDLSAFTRQPPNLPSLYNPDGTLDLVASNFGYQNTNPLAFTLTKFSSTVNNLISSADFSYTITKGLEIKTNLGYNHTQYNDITTNPIAAQDPSVPETGSATFIYNSTTSWIAEPQLTYDFHIGTNKFNLLAGSTFQESTNSGLILNGSGYTSDALLLNIQAAPYPAVDGDISATDKYIAVFGRFSYNYDDKYLVDLNWRRDGSSRFGPANQFNNFASVGAGYIFTKEPFVENVLPFLSFGKIRGSFGTTGSDQIGDYKYLTLFQTTPITYQNDAGLISTSLSNPQLAWEETRKLEGGLELGFLKDRILLNVSYYYNRTSNELILSPLPSITGNTSVLENLPATVQNTGLELSINTINLKKGNFSWTSSFNLTVPENKLVSFPNLSNSPYAGNLTIGEPINDYKLFKYLGVDPATGVYEFLNAEGKPTFVPTFGTDQIVNENPTPRYYGGIQNTFSYKNLDISFFFTFRDQLGINYLLAQAAPPGSFPYNEPVAYLNNWKQPGDHSSIERFTQSPISAAFLAYQYAQLSNYALVNDSFARLSNLSLSYKFSHDLLTRLHLQALTCFVRCENLLTITRYKGMDPETQSLTALPPLRMITTGFNLSL